MALDPASSSSRLCLPTNTLYEKSVLARGRADGKPDRRFNAHLNTLMNLKFMIKCIRHYEDLHAGTGPGGLKFVPSSFLQ